MTWIRRSAVVLGGAVGFGTLAGAAALSLAGRRAAPRRPAPVVPHAAIRPAPPIPPDIPPAADIPPDIPPPAAIPPEGTGGLAAAIPPDATGDPGGDALQVPRPPDGATSGPGPRALRWPRRLLIGLAATVCLAAIAIGVTFSLLGWRAYVVHTGSMSPTIPPGDLVVDRPARTARVGDVITFAKTPGNDITHRVAAVTPRGLRTRGDANPSDDYGVVHPDQIAGRVVAAIPDAGYVVVFLSHPTGDAGVVLFFLAVWLAWGLLLAPPPVPEPALAGHLAGGGR